ncbi:MAG: AAA family ATPase [Acetatifactor sp.]|nr:AAA family ATPase [Acetatifactor sp.]
MLISKEVEEIISTTVVFAQNANFEFVVPELMLYVICKNEVFARAFENCGGSIRELDYHLRTYLENYVESRDETDGSDSELSQDMQNVLERAMESAQNSGRDRVELSHILFAIYGLEDSYAAYYMLTQGVERAELLREMGILYEEIADGGDTRGRVGAAGSGSRNNAGGSNHTAEEDEQAGDGQRGAWSENGEDRGQEKERHSGRRQNADWQQYAVCLNDMIGQVNPLIGREEELERTMQILCRKEKNNPLHIGEPGVGKTAITYGLARRLEEAKVPEPLQGAKIFSLDLGGLLAGTQYRGDFEQRFKKVMDGICSQERPIVYIDEIHNIVGAGAVGGGAFDISNMLKPYLERGQVRFIGATTYEEYKKHFEKSKSLVRRFQNIDIKEPDIQDCVHILEGLKAGYEQFHGVTYEEGTLEYAVEMSAKYINERFLPDKAVDLIDEAGAYRRMHPLEGERQSVDKELLDELLSGICHIPRQVVESDETAALATLEERLQRLIFGQNEAISQVVNAVKFSKAGLLEEGKPLASLLFVGPTGVGKTEIAKSLAKELGIELVRFDMSEYEEKHAVAKLIGAPAGYVGYEEGGLLTEEIRKHPHAVLLLDEIEKAHSDIYNILLQVMDYATLTDNQGRKADFRNIILIMTSNAGASRIGKPGIGFLGENVNTDAVLEEVKRIFQPEFRNRLTKTVVFNSMDDRMAEQIVDKKLGELGQMLQRKNIELSADEKSRKLIKKKGISAEFGAREIERVIQGEIKPLLVDEILFGALKDGGRCRLTCVDEVFAVSEEEY